jgi:hypothetical protein
MWRELLKLEVWRAAAKESLPLVVPFILALPVLLWFGPDFISDAGDYLRARIGEGGTVLVVGGGYLLILFVGLVLAKAKTQAELRRQQRSCGDMQGREDDL